MASKSEQEKALLDSISFSYRTLRTWCRENRASLIGEHRQAWKLLLIQPLWNFRRALRARDVAQSDLEAKVLGECVVGFERLVIRAKEKARKAAGGKQTAINRGGDAWKRRVDDAIKLLYDRHPELKGNAAATAKQLSAQGTLQRQEVKLSTVEKYIQAKNRLLKK